MDYHAPLSLTFLSIDVYTPTVMAHSIRVPLRHISPLRSRLVPRPFLSPLRLKSATVTLSKAEVHRKIRHFHTATKETEATSPAHRSSVFATLDTFQRRHIGPSNNEVATMLAELNYPSLDSFVKDVLPPSILSSRNLKVAPEDGLTENQLLERLREIAIQNRSDLKSFIGCGYSNTLTPNVILRNILECPEWYTSYTPYQPEISQGTARDNKSVFL